MPKNPFGNSFGGLQKQRPEISKRPQGGKRGPGTENVQIEPIDDLLEELAKKSSQAEVRGCGCGGKQLKEMFRQ